jgi:hypothetical protein
MRRIHLVTVVVLILIALIVAFSQTPRSTTQSRAQPAKPKGKVLVQRLPDGVEGVVLDKKTAALKLKSGYQFVKQENGSIGVAARMAGGGPGNIVFTGTCNCLPPKGQTASGECTASIIEESLTCQKGSCSGDCKLAVTVGGKSTGLIIY